MRKVIICLSVGILGWLLFVPTKVGAVVMSTECRWCGDRCTAATMGLMCTDVEPPSGKLCVRENGSCTIKSDVPVKSCITDKECGVGAYCYQPPMPVCKPGMACIEVMPGKYCRSCTPRLACMDANPACMPDLAAGAPPFCPPTKKLANEGEMCGGLAGIMCVSGLRCEYGLMPEKLPAGGTGTQGMMADQSGVCVKDTIYCDTGKCPAGYECVGMNTRCPMGPDGMPTKCAIRPYCKKIVLTPTPVLKCGWCGLTCGPVLKGQACPEIMPPVGASCVEDKGKCITVPVSLTPSPTCVPRPACLDLPQPCKLPERPEYCPKPTVRPTCIPRPDCLDGIKDPVTGTTVYCDMRPGVVFCPINGVKGDANGDGKVDLVDFSIWKKEYISKLIAKADFNKDGKVDLVDFSIWKNSYLNLSTTN